MSQTNLNDLPLEVIQNLGGYLDLDDIANVRKSSSYIDHCLSDEYFWKTFARSHIRPSFPPYKPDISKFDWETNVTKYLKERKYWDMSNLGIKISHPRNNSDNAVNAILITKDGKYCITSALDKELSLWDLRTLFTDSCRPPLACNSACHTEWIWNIHQNDANIYTASIDKTVKIWDLDTNLKLVKTMNFEVPVLSVTTLDTNTVCMGLENGVLAFADSRVPETCEQVKVHNMPVLKIVARNYTTISCSSDYNISIVDRRRPTPILRQVPYLPSFGSPQLLSLCDYYLLVAGSKGDVHFFDADSFTHKGKFNVTNGSYYKITGLCHNMGSIVVAATPGNIEQYTLTNPPKLKRRFIIEAIPLCLHYSNEIIAVGTSTSTAFVITHTENNLISK